MHQITRLNVLELAEREPEATFAYLQSTAAVYTLLAQRALSEFRTMPRAWQNAFDMSNWPLRLTPSEAETLQAELRGVMARYRLDTPEEAAAAPEEAERVSLIMHVLPELDAPAAS